MQRPVPAKRGRLKRAIARPRPSKKSKTKGNTKRDNFAFALGGLTLAAVALAFILAHGTRFLMPGPLASVHNSIEECGACHTDSGKSKVSWIRGIVSGSSHKDSEACLVCHKMPVNTAFNSHSTSNEQLTASTERLREVAAKMPTPRSARMRTIAFPMGEVMGNEVPCATCHQEHQGLDFKLNEITNDQCQSCHIVQFDNFDGNHPKFSKFPFERRTRLIYDHGGHFRKHYPEVAGKNTPSRVIPKTCSDCHTSRDDRRVMVVKPFEETCTSCHLDQIVGKERATGPKGIAFLALPGIDVETLKSKDAAIGEWPELSEAEITPFMKVLISRNDEGTALINTVSKLDLLDLTQASDEEIAAVTKFVWEVKGLFYALVSAKASDVLAKLDAATATNVTPQLISDLTAGLPRDVIVGAQREWLPNLAAEMARRETSSEKGPDWTASVTESKLAASVAPDQIDGPTASEPPTAENQIRLAQARNRSRAPSGISPSNPSGSASAEFNPFAEAQIGNRAAPPADNAASPPPKASGGSTDGVRQAQQAAPKSEEEQIQSGSWRVDPFGRLIKGPNDAAAPEGASPDSGSNSSDSSDSASQDTAAEPNDPATAGDPGSAQLADPSQSPESDNASGTGLSAPPDNAIQSDVDAESWAEYGGWYRQDFAVFYKPANHKDKFIGAWLDLTAPVAQKDGAGPAAAVFEKLTSKDAQGQCTKCHSVDDVPGKGRRVNWTPASVATKQGRFTNFVHEPHFGVLETRGCLTCHKLDQGTQYLESYKQGNPVSFISNFTSPSKDLCQTCHTQSGARQDCLLCHKYHVNGVITPIMNTQLPKQ